MYPKGMTNIAANEKLKEIKDAARVALRSCLKVPDNESLDTLTLNAEKDARWAMFNKSYKKDGDKEATFDMNCLATDKIFVKPHNIPEPIISPAAVPQIPVDQPRPTVRAPYGSKKHSDKHGD